MNGIGLLVLIVVAGQVTPVGPKAQNRDWGWEVDKEGALCYIVQLSPQKVTEMQDTGWEYPSDMPEELVGRATRIVFRIGTALLPQTPSLEEIKKLPRFNSPTDVTAQLGPGRMSDVEAGALYNVQQDRSPPTLPSFGSATTPSSLDPAGNLIEQAQQNSNALVDKMKNYVRGTPDVPGFPSGAGAASPNPAATATNDSPSLPGYPGAAGTNKFNAAAGNSFNDRSQTNNGAANNGAAAGSGNWQSIPNTNYDGRSRDDMTRVTDNRLQTPASSNPNGYGTNNGSQQNSGYGPGAYAGAGGYDSRDPASLTRDMFNGVPNRQTPAGGFGTFSGSNNPGNYTATNSGQINSGQYGGGYGREDYAGRQNPNYNPVYPNDQVNRVASNPPGNGSLLGTTAPPAMTNSTTNPPAASADSSASASKPPQDSKASQNILPVFFLLSLVVNLYLGFLISKLLKRYRALLANMRGQTTTNAYS